MSVFERYLTLWVALAKAAVIAIGSGGASVTALPRRRRGPRVTRTRGLGRAPQRRPSDPIDKSDPIVYLNSMPKFVRILFVALLAVFAAGSIVHATSTTTMAVKMVLAGSGPMDMADCTGCDADGNGDKGGLACDLVCTAPFVADLGTESILSVPVAVSAATPKGAYDFVGRTGSPDPYPPRTLI